MITVCYEIPIWTFAFARLIFWLFVALALTLSAVALWKCRS